MKLRPEEQTPSLDEWGVDPNPLLQFSRWMEEALSAQLPEPNAVAVATASKDGSPSARIVLLRGFDQRGFVFYTNYESQKARDLAENPRASLLFHWAGLHRQVRIVGTVEKVSRAESEAYFLSRPVGSRLGAWTSRQSQVIPGREVLEERLRELTQQFEGDEVPLPDFWGGYRVAPETFEFWQSRPSRLHDRLRYTRQPGGDWRIDRLSP